MHFVNPIYRNLTGDRAQMPYQLRTTAPETLLIGSSRVQMAYAHRTGLSRRCSERFAGRGDDAGSRQIVSLAFRIQKLKRIVWGVDFYAFNDRAAPRRIPSFDRRLQLDPGILVEDSLLSLRAIGDSFDVLKRAIGGPPTQARDGRERAMAAGFDLRSIHRATRSWPCASPARQISRLALAQVQSWFYADYEFSSRAGRTFPEVVNMAPRTTSKSSSLCRR